ncbi:MAG: hypothetical protein U9Q95_02485 [Candidatus Eisenbacteria bacterium]|nr:hypothetical protein [Candidatus Eisenbacteria bacterium]
MPFGQTLIVALLAALVLAAAATCTAQIPEKINYQVMLTDDADQPLAEQSVQLVFRIYNVDAGGGSLWTETHNVVTNSIGVVSVVLGTYNPLSLAFDGPLWLQVAVDGEIMSPRRELTSAPYALSVSGSGGGDGHSLDADDGSPTDALYVDANGDVGIGTTSPQAELHVSEELQVGSTATLGALTVHGGSAANGAIRLQGEGVDGGSIYIDGGMGATCVTLGPTNQAGGGGRLMLGKNDGGTTGVLLEGNYNDDEEPGLLMTGSTRSLQLYMGGGSNDYSVFLPEDSINASEILDEPGVASIQTGSYTNLTLSNVTSVAARTMTDVPADGFVFVMATAELVFANSPSQDHTAKFGVSEFQNVWSTHAQETQIQIPAGLPEGNYRYHVAASALFAVSEGSNTFYLNAQELAGGCVVEARQLTLMYFPTSYGAVDTTD